jgi:hypothetical protein
MNFNIFKVQLIDFFINNWVFEMSILCNVSWLTKLKFEQNIQLC